MSGSVITLFDSLSVREEAFQYSIELAKRMDYSLIVLVLLALDSQDVTNAKDFELRAKDALQGPLESARLAGVHMEAEVRMGDPSSELIKFLAGSKSVQTIVWGGSRDVVHTRANKAHWLARMKDVLECPVVVPKRKS